MDWSTNLQMVAAGLAMGSIYALVALGFVLIFNAVNVVNFAQGEFAMVPAFVAVWLMNSLNTPFALTCVITVVFMGIFGIIFQRIAYAALALVFLAGALHAPRGAGGRRVYGVLVALATLVGAGIAGRHVWVQMQPAGAAPSCGPPLSFLQETMGPMELVRKVLTGEVDSLHQSMIAMQEAGVAFSLMVEVRNKLMESYQQVMRMQV
mgnify:CR=1 FL=1